MATFTVYAGEEYLVDHAAGSGLGFFGAGGFGYSVAVGAYQARTYITDANGTIEGAEVDNNRYSEATGVIFGQTGEPHPLTEMPNDKTTMNLRFDHTSSIDTQNAELRAYDGTDVDAAPSGFKVFAYEAVHPGITYVDNGSGDASFTDMSGASSLINLSDSPGSGGLYAWSGHASPNTRHDWYVGCSVTPDSVGAKTAKLYFSLEYL